MLQAGEMAFQLEALSANPNVGLILGTRVEEGKNLLSQVGYLPSTVKHMCAHILSEYFQELSKKLMGQICFPRFDVLRLVGVCMLGCESKASPGAVPTGRVLPQSFLPDKG